MNSTHSSGPGVGRAHGDWGEVGQPSGWLTPRRWVSTAVTMLATKWLMLCCLPQSQICFVPYPNKKGSHPSPSFLNLEPMHIFLNCNLQIKRVAASCLHWPWHNYPTYNHKHTPLSPEKDKKSTPTHTFKDLLVMFIFPLHSRNALTPFVY